MKFPWTIVAALAVNSLTAMPESKALREDGANENSIGWSNVIESEVKDRIARLNMPFKARYSQEVGNTIKDYVTKGYHGTEIMLGRRSAYFPIFEHYLNIYGLPKELRYLPIVETGLDANAFSQAGAAGLWQFIRPSARLYDLKVDANVDERLDAYRATEAAAQMLSNLYDHYKDWALALAAYNCGPVRVNAAIREAGSRDFYIVANFLPSETRNYIPRFIAAAYISSYYQEHGLTPRSASAFAQPLRAVKLFEQYTFGEIAHASGVPVAVLQELNPAYRSSIVPKSVQGNYLLLPAHGLPALQRFIAARSGGAGMNYQLLYPNAYPLQYLVKPGDTLDGIAVRFRRTAREIMTWNQLREASVFANQELSLYVSDMMEVVP